MKKIRELKENDRLTMPLLVQDCRNGTTTKGAPYLNLVLQDNSGSIDGKFWDVKPEARELIAAGRIIRFTFEVILYNKNLQLRINKAEPCSPDEIDYDEFVISSGRSEQERKDKTKYFLNSIKNENYRKLVKGMLEKVGLRYFSYPAASRIHHNFLGGLSEHSIGMAELAEELCRLYPQLNRDLLISGILIHDTGKTAEMSGPVTTEYTLEGRLEGHISIANGWLSEVAAELSLEDSEEAVLLHHMILSHHGHYEFGSPVLPMVQEAEVLSLIDNLDAKLNTMKQALDSVKPGEWTLKLFSMENRQFYKPKNGEDVCR
ncbi:MAG: HD domain-containing protein [Solobacterium sp.]|nr:HD domain-containing protein [Solobacterium sp.]